MPGEIYKSGDNLMSSGRKIFQVVFAVLCLSWNAHGQQVSSPHSARYSIPAKGTIPVAFVITDDAVTIDFAGPWEVFKDVFLKDRGKTLAEQEVFRLYTVSDTREPVKTSGGMRIVPDYTFDDAPEPAIVVVPAQRGRSPKMLQWIRERSAQSQVVMSVCTGAFVLGDAGILKGKKATTHHLYYDEFQTAFPDVLLQKNKRFVESDSVLFTAGGLSTGIDLALHIVQLYGGTGLAEETAKLLEYEGTGRKVRASIRNPAPQKLN
jgi:transcriptional regulator GlxA family with amidase domain